MKRVIRYQTSDGVLHLSDRDAIRHADKRFGEALTRIVHQILRVDKYVAMLDFIEQNLDAFVELKALKSDMEFSNREDSEEDDE